MEELRELNIIEDYADDIAFSQIENNNNIENLFDEIEGDEIL